MFAILKNTISLEFQMGKASLYGAEVHQQRGLPDSYWTACAISQTALCSSFTKVFDSLNKIENHILRKIQRSHCRPGREKRSPGEPGKRPQKEKGVMAQSQSVSVVAEVPLFPQLAHPTCGSLFRHHLLRESWAYPSLTTLPVNSVLVVLI